MSLLEALANRKRQIGLTLWSSFGFIRYLPKIEFLSIILEQNQPKSVKKTVLSSFFSCFVQWVHSYSYNSSVPVECNVTRTKVNNSA